MKRCEPFNSMKAIAFSVLALCLAVTALSTESPQSASPQRLAGIVSLADRPCVVLEAAGRRRSLAKLLILSEGQRDEGVQVVKIAPDKGSVELVWEGAGSTTVRLNNATNLSVPGIVLEDVGLNAVLQLFGPFTNRSLLRWPYLPASSFSLRASAKDRAGAAQVLAQALVAEELSIIPDGEKFLMIVPKSEAATVKPHAPPTKASPGGGTKTQATSPGPGPTEQELIPPGMIDFRSADLSQVVAIYSVLLGRTLDPGGPPNVNGTISFHTQNRLTKEEAVYALETLLEWSGVKLVPVGEDKLKAVRAWEN